MVFFYAVIRAPNFLLVLVRPEVHAHTLDLSMQFRRGSKTGIDLLLVSPVTSLAKFCLDRERRFHCGIQPSIFLQV